MANLAMTYSKQRRWKEAEELQLDVMEVRRSVFGVEHPDTMTIMVQLAATYWNQGRLKKAENLERELKNIRHSSRI